MDGINGNRASKGIVAIILCLSLLLSGCGEIASPGDELNPSEEAAESRKNLERYWGLTGGEADTATPTPTQSTSQTISLVAPKVTSSTMSATVNDIITVSWEEVVNAQGYTIYLTGSQQQVISTTSTSISIELSKPGSLGIYVYATGTYDGNWAQSDQSIGVNIGISPQDATDLYSGYYDGTYTYLSRVDLQKYVDYLNLVIEYRKNTMTREAELEPLKNGFYLLGSSVVAGFIYGSPVGAAGMAAGGFAAACITLITITIDNLVGGVLGWLERADLAIEKGRAIRAEKNLDDNTTASWFRFKGKELKSGVDLEAYK